ncbi:MAG: pirin family protein [Holophagaceae bacterium]|nr:pirin family protein [Holophagaceae bacterium]
MMTLRRAKDRGHFDFGWLDTRHTFSFGDFFDPDHHHFRALRVINEDVVQPGQGFGTHGHRDMEILTWVLEGGLAHKDSLGSAGVIRPGEAQAMSAGTGIQHSEFNASAEEPVHFLQIWVVPDAKGLAPRYQQLAFEDAALRNRLGLIASRDGREGSVRLSQDVAVEVARLDPGATVRHAFEPGRGGWLHVAKGTVQTGGLELKQGDGLVLEDEAALEVTALASSEILLFDLG